MPVTINGTTGIAGPDGSASTPAVQGTDSNTGLFFPAADTVAITTGGTQRVTVDSSGNLLAGATSTSGDATNTKIVAGGRFRTVSGSVSANNGTATTLFTAPTAIGVYLVSIAVDADTVIYSATSIISTQGGSSTNATAIKTGANVSITVSGYAVQGTQSSGATATISYSAIRIF